MLGERLRSARERAGKTQADAAKHLGITRPAYTQYEIGRRDPDTDSLRKLAELFDVTTDYLLAKADSPTDETSAQHNDPDQAAFLKWVEENLEGTFYYDFNRSPDDAKKHMMETLRLVWEREKGRKPGQKQGE